VELIKIIKDLFGFFQENFFLIDSEGNLIITNFPSSKKDELQSLIKNINFKNENLIYNLKGKNFYKLKLEIKKEKFYLFFNFPKNILKIDELIESSYDGLYITDGNANTIMINSAYERITGLKRENLIGRNMRDLVREGIFDHSVTLEVLKKRKPVTIMQKIMGNKKVMVTGNPIFNESGEITFVVTNVRDVTELVDLRMKLEETQKLSSLYYETLREETQFKNILNKIIANSSVMQKVLLQAIKVAGVDTSVLITGESGSGKTMLAKIIHECSPRKNKPFVKINCGAIPETLIESELFGYEKGAFTGALPTGKAGLIEMANGGTLFLDEVSELTLNAQVKLLNVLEDKTFTRVGGTKPNRVDVRIIAATNVDLKDYVEKGKFREDLYYRLNVIPIKIPPLRERKEDIPLLIYKFVKDFNKKTGMNKKIPSVVIEKMLDYPYPGNIRELQNIVERMLILSEDDEIKLSDLPHEFKDEFYLEDNIADGKSLKEVITEFEKKFLLKTIPKYKNLTHAAKSLNIHPSTLLRKLQKLNIKINQ